MITGASSLIIGIPVSIGALGVVGGIVGIGLGIAGLRRAGTAGLGGKSLAAWGVTVSAIAVVAGGALLATLGPSLVDGFARGVEQGMPAGQPADPVPYATSDGPAKLPAEAMNPDGEWEDMPHFALQLGQDAIIGDYKVTVIAIELDADATMAAASPRNPPPFGQYVMATVSVAYRGVSEGTPLDDLMVSYPATDNYIYDETSCAAVTARPVSNVGTLALDETVEYDVCLDVYPESIGQPRVLVHDMTSESWDAKMWSAE